MADRKTRELLRLHDLARELRAHLDRQSVFQSIVRCAQELLGCAAVGIGVRDPDRPVLVHVASAGTAVPQELPLRLDTMSGRAFHEHRTVVENAYATNNPAALPVILKSGFTAGMAVPICEEGRPIGVMIAGHMGEGQLFDADDVELFETLAWMAEIGLAAASRSVELMRKTARAEALQVVLQELSESHDLQEIAERALSTATSLFGADRGAVWLRTGEESGRCLASRGLSAGYVRAVEAKFPRAPGTRSFASLRPTLIRDVTDVRFFPLREEAEREGFRAVLVVPMVFEGRATGALSLYHDIPWSYTDEDITLATALAQQLGVAIAHAQLYDETRRQLGRVSVLSEIGRAGVETLDLVARCDRAARALVRGGDIDAAAIYLIDDSGARLVNASFAPEVQPPASFDLTTDTIATRCVTGVRVVSSDEADVPARSRESLRQAGLEHGIAVPMVHQGRVVGALLAGRKEQPFEHADIELVRAAANQLAAAVEHSRVFGQLAEASARLSAILRSAPEGILVFGPDQRVAYFNAEVQRMYGLEGRDLVGWTPADFEREIGGHFADPDVPKEIVRRIRDQPTQVHRMEYDLLRPTRRRIERVSAPVLGEQGQFLGQVVLFHDVSVASRPSMRLVPDPSSGDRDKC